MAYVRSTPFACAAAREVPWWQGWLPLALLPAAVLFLAPPSWPGWLRMWVLAVGIFFCCKWLTWRRTPAPGAPWWKHAGYLVAWPGLDAPAFLRHPVDAASAVGRPTLQEWLFAAGKLGLGIAWLWGVVRWLPAQYPYLVGWAGMVGLVFLLHFGSFHLLSCFWRSRGVDARPLMHWPVAATSLGEFWAFRWNRAFRDFAHRFLFRPLTQPWGPAPAILAGFLFSGVVHDLVISWPAGRGFGGPTLFFVIQGAALLLERTRVSRRLGLGRGGRGWLFTAMVVLLPAPLLFHPAFVVDIVVPFLRALGAIR